MSHTHDHHSVNVTSLNKAFITGIILNLAFVAAEFIAGWHYDSLALLSDAGHNLSDVASLVLALLAFRLAKVRPTDTYTYGYKKSTILVSLLNALILVAAVAIIIAESIEKIKSPSEVPGTTIAWIAGIGVLVNGFTAFLFMKDKEKDLNVKGAYLHMAADALVSVGVLVSGLVISHTGLHIIDPIIGIVVAVIIFISTLKLLHDSVRLALDGVPANIDARKVYETIETTPGVKDMHHLHIWAISTTENALTAHLVITDVSRMKEIKNEVRHRLKHCGISHATLELETEGENCRSGC